MFAFLKKHFKANKLILAWVLIATVFGSFSAFTNPQFLNSRKESYAAESCPDNGSLQSINGSSRKVCATPYCDEGDVYAIPNKEKEFICINNNKELLTEQWCNDGQKPKLGGECDFKQTGLESKENGEPCSAGYTQVYSVGGIRNGKLCSIAPKFFSFSTLQCDGFNKLIRIGINNGQVNKSDNGSVVEAVFNNEVGPNSPQSCLASCPKDGHIPVVFKDDIDNSKDPITSRNLCSKIIRTCGADCVSIEACNDNFVGICQTKAQAGGKDLFGSIFAGLARELAGDDYGIMYYKVDNRSSCSFWIFCGPSGNNNIQVVDQQIRRTSAPCESGKVPFFGYTGSEHNLPIGGILCVSKSYITPIKYVAGGAISSQNPRQCSTIGMVELYFEDKKADDLDMDLLCAPKRYSPSIPHNEWNCPESWTSFYNSDFVENLKDRTKEVCQKSVQYEVQDLNKVNVSLSASCDKDTVKNGEIVVCEARFSNFISGKITFSSDKKSCSNSDGDKSKCVESCEKNITQGNDRISCDLKMNNDYYSVEEFQIKVKLDEKYDITKLAGKIKVIPLGCTSVETELSKVCEGELAKIQSYKAPELVYDGSFPGSNTVIYNSVAANTNYTTTQSTTKATSSKTTTNDNYIDTNNDGVKDKNDVQPTKDTNGDGKIDKNDLFDTNSDGKIDKEDVQPTKDTNGDGKIDKSDLFDTNNDGKIDQDDIQPTKDTNGDGKIDKSDLFDTNSDGKIDKEDVQPTKDTNGDGKIDKNDLFDTNNDGKIDKNDVQPTVDTNGDGKIDKNDLIDSNNDGVIDYRDVQPTKDTNGDGKIDKSDLFDTNRDGLIDYSDVQPISDSDASKADYLNNINYSSDPLTIATDKEISDAIKCSKDEKDKAVVICTGQLPPGKTAENLKIKVGDQEISCDVNETGKITCPPTKIKELDSNPDQNLSFSVSTKDNPDFIETKKINFAKNIEVSCTDNYAECFDNQATEEELARAIKCVKDVSDETVVICEGQLPAGKIAEDLKIKIGDNSIVSCSVDSTGKIKCAPVKVTELSENPDQDLSFSILDKFHNKLTEVKKYNFFTGKESFCSVADTKCINQRATRVSLAQNQFIDRTCSGLDNKCLSGTGDFGNAKGYQKNGYATSGPNLVLIISLVLMSVLAVGVGIYIYFKYFKKDKEIT